MTETRQDIIKKAWKRMYDDAIALDAGVPNGALTAEMREELDRVYGKEVQFEHFPPVRIRGPKKPTPPAPPRGQQVLMPEHYARYKIEPIRFLMENMVDGFQYNIVKYIMRHAFKNGMEDVKKVLRYAEMCIKKLYLKDPDWWGPSTLTINGKSLEEL